MTSQNGNVLFLILLAVALFAALSYAVTQSSRGGGDVGPEKVKVMASEIVQFGTVLRATTDRLLIRGCDITEINVNGLANNSINSNNTLTTNNNPLAPGDGSCNLYHKNGGGIADRLLPEASAADGTPVSGGWMHPQSYWIMVSDVRSPQYGPTFASDPTDLIVWIGRLTDEVCTEINDNLGITNPSGEPPAENWTWNCGGGSTYTGLIDQTCANPIGDVITELQNHDAYCLTKDDGHNDYSNFFIQVLHRR